MGIAPDGANVAAGLDRESGERLFGGRYRATRLLKDGLGVETLLGTDLVQGDAVVIKTVSEAVLTTAARMRLEHEGEVLGQIRIPEVASLRGLGREGDRVYLVVAFIPGMALQARLGQGPLSVGETLVLARCLLTALAEIHARGVLHRDVKPANLMVDKSSPLQWATLIDFGLARSARLHVSVRDQRVGTVLYMSPEQAGLLDREVDERSDLYSAGIVIFECLAGHPPFQAEAVGDLLRQHLTGRPADLRSMGTGVPRALDEMTQRLLRKDPRDRYQSAGAVLEDLKAVAEALEHGTAEPAVVIGLHDRRRTLAEPAFVGRGDELAALEDQLESARVGAGGLVLVEAESGGGKTRLLDELAQRAARLGMRVLHGQGLDQAAQRPFQVLTGVAKGLIAGVELEPGAAETIRQRLGDQRAAVAAALPEMARTLGSDASDLLGPETFGETRSLQALTSLFNALGDTASPALVLLDDCQWADDLTVKLLGSWQKRQEQRGQPSRCLLVVVAFRSEEVSAGHPLRALQTAAHLRLPPFSAADVQRLAESMAGPLPLEVVEVVERLSEGSPFMASAVLRGLVEAGAMLPDAAGWRAEPAALADVRSSHHAAAFLARRIELLSAEAIRLLTVGAVLGREFDLELAALLAGHAAHQAAAVLKEARRRCIVWSRGEGGRYVFFHDKLRETLLARATDDQRRQLHRLTAQHLESHDRTRVFDLAYHFDAAGESQHALSYALAAAEQARNQHSLELAEQQYRIAERGAQAADRTTRYRIAEGLGDVLMLRGRYEEAEIQTVAARSLAKGEIARAKIEGKLGEIAFKRGDIQTATEAIERSLAVLGRKPPQWTAAFFLLLLREAIVQVLHTLAPQWFLARKPLKGADQELLSVHLYNRLAYAYWFGRGQIPCLWAHLCGMNLGERYPPTLELAHAYSTHSPVMSLVAYFSRGLSYTQKSIAICKSMGALWGQGQACNFNGLVLSVASRFEECIEKCREAVRLMERTGDVWEVNIAHYHIANSLYRLGRLSAAVAEARRIYQSGLELGDIQASGICCDVWVWASGGKVDPEVLHTELQRPRADVQVSAQLMLAEGSRLFMLDRVEEAAAFFEKGLQLTEKTGVKNAWTFPLLPWLASALRRQAEKTSTWAPERRHELLKRAGKTAKKALGIGRTFQNILPHALREAGLVAAMQGSIRRARKHLEESLAVAQRQGARLEYAQTLLARGQVGRTHVWPGAEEDLKAARQELSAMGADFALDQPRENQPPEQVTLSLADRFDTVLGAGRRIASALSKEAIFASVREAALKLLRGEQCLVFQTAPDGAAEPTPGTKETIGEHSRTMVRRALASARAMTFVEGLSGDVSESVLLSGVRSALCAPIFVRGKPAGCFYVTHREVSGLFGEDEQRLAEFIATIAGAALENAAGFEELRTLNETLEDRVAERSATVEARSKELARSNAELEQFASIASHDLQEPLRKVQAFGDLLAEKCNESVNEEGQYYLQRMQNAAKRMQQLINDLLAFARVTSHAKPFMEVDLGRVALEVVGDLEAHIRDGGGKVTIGELPTIDADPTQMRQLFQNLISNALKYRRPDHAPLVEVQSRLLGPDGAAGPGPRCEITVRDDGIGFDEKYLDRIFVPFQRLHSRDQYEGTGIGLAICRKIVERHDGTLTARSALGQGSTFIAVLPLHQPKGPQRHE